MHRVSSMNSKEVPASERVKVFIRVKPEAEAKGAKGPGTLSIVNDTTIQIAGNGKSSRDKQLSFTEVFPENSTQDQMYAKVEHLVAEAVQGYNSSVFAYGAMASGKTYTMIGNKNDPGIMPRAIRDLFKHVERIQTEDPSVLYFIECTYVEIYNNKFRNLLRADDTDRIDIHESSNLGVFLTGGPNLRVAMTTADQAIGLISQGNLLRTTRTKNRVSSSRGHAILTFFIERRQFHGGQTKLLVGSLTLVDLAGIEKLTASSAAGPQHGELLIEAQSINSSLNGVGDVLSALAEDAKKARTALRRTSSTASNATDLSAYLDSASNADVGDNVSVSGKDPDTASVTASAGPGMLSRQNSVAGGIGGKPKGMHIPYMNAKLTHFLKEALGGNCRTTMIFTLLPGCDSNTSTVLMYAEWAMKVVHWVKLNVINTEENWTVEKDPEAAKLRSNLENRSKEAEEMHRKNLLGLNLPPPPTPEEAVVMEIDNSFHELENLRRNSLVKQPTIRLPPPTPPPPEEPTVSQKALDDCLEKCSACDKERDALKAANAELEKKVKAVGGFAEELRGKLASSEAALGNERSQLLKLQGELGTAGRLSNAAEAALNAEKANTRRLEAELEAAERQRAAAEAALAAEKANTARLDAALIAAGGVVHVCPRCPELEVVITNQHEINRLSTLNTKELSAKNTELTNALNASRSDLEVAEHRNALLDAEVAKLKKEVELLQAQCVMKNKQLKEETSKVADLEKSLAEEEKTLAEEAKRLGAMQGKLNAAADTRDTLLAAAEGRIAALEKSLAEGEAREAGLHRDLGVLATAIEGLNATIAEKDALIAELIKQLNSAERLSESGELQGRLDALTAQLAELSAAKSGLEAKNASLNSELVRVRAEYHHGESSDEEVDTEMVEVEQTIIETEVVGEDGEIEIRREVVETTRTTHTHDLQHHASKVHLAVEGSVEKN